MPVIVTRASNNYGPNQFPEKVIPLFITNAIDNMPLPLYGDGLNVRDWLHVDDHCRAIDLLIDQRPARRGLQHRRRQRSDRTSTSRTASSSWSAGPSRSIQPVADRPGHDRRYALDTTKLRPLGWQPQVPFDDGPGERPSTGIGRTSGGGARSRNRIRRSGPTTRPQYGSRSPVS